MNLVIQITIFSVKKAFARANYEKMQVVRKIFFRVKFVSYMCKDTVCKILAKKIDLTPPYGCREVQNFARDGKTHGIPTRETCRLAYLCALNGY